MNSNVLLLLIGLSSLVTTCHAFQLTIVHTNDVHARFEEANAEGGKCKNASRIAEKCYGGVARRLTKIRELNSTNPNMILIDAGDQYQGTLWFNVFKGHAAAHFMNRLGYQAMAIGNHEFDLGVAGLLPLLNNASFPILSANIDASREPSVDGKFVPSTVLTVNGEKIGIIGYTTVDTPSISNSGKLIFTDEVEAIQPIVDEMTRNNITKIIALGHSGYSRDQELARQLRGVDVIVGGHSHTFLYTGTPAPTDDEVIGPYPTVETNPDGDTVLVVQDYFAGKFLGYLKVNFTDEGKVSSWEGDPILLNASVPQDPAIMAELNVWREEVLNVSRQTVGSSLVMLEGRRTICRLQECNLGNLIADSMIWNMVQLNPPNNSWISAAIGIMNSGGIRTSIEQGEVSMEDILTVMPFQNNIDLIKVSGRVLLKALEHSVAKYEPKSPRGEFLQVSGLRIVFDLRKPVGERVVDVRARCQQCDMPVFERLKLDETYTIVIPAFTADGGDGFDWELGTGDREALGFLDSDLFTKFVKKFSPMYASVDGRIRLCTEEDHDSLYCTQDIVHSTLSPNTPCPGKPTNTASKPQPPLLKLTVSLVPLLYLLLL